ncbi:hypothetical protein HHI36_001249 [Cryptolaemus montrouzieri]|uniref:Uncharacterized protein n=1 Tax=Cryptolaemus montrouzieri TaxID=559131 RepID=A0ABD2P732_9CUCU
MDGDASLKISNEISFTSVPKDIVFPDELNRYLREQVEYLFHENGMLKKHLREKETSYEETSSELENLKLKVKENENIGSKNAYSSATTIASAKIAELSKRLREKNSEVESLKTKCSKLERKIFELQESKLQGVTENKYSDENNDASPKPENEELLKKTRDKLGATSFKLREVQNANIQLKNELKVANKYLQQEVGDTFENINNNKNSRSWRGRAQIICDLQQKNQELREKLKLYQRKS